MLNLPKIIILTIPRIQFNSIYETINLIEAKTILPNGAIEKATQIQELSPYSGFPLYSSNKVKIVTLPAVVENSIIEIKKIIEGTKIFKGEYWDQWFFQYTAPLLECSYKITLPIDRKLYISKKNLDIEPTTTKSKDERYITYYWHKQNIEKAEAEEMAPPFGQTFPQIALSTIEDWERLGSLLWGLYKDKIEPDKAIIKKAKKITKKDATDLEKLESILRYIQDNFRYVSLSFGSNVLEPHKAAETFYNKYGDCKDQCTLLSAMLKVVGIKSTPSLDTATLFLFDSSTAWFEEVSPPDILNYTGKTDAKINLNPDGSAQGEIKLIPGKVQHPAYRETFKEMTDKKKDEYCSAVISLIAPGGEITSFVYADPEDYREPFFIQIRFTAPSFVAITGKYIILDIMESTNTMFFSKPNRTQPIVSYFPICKLEKYEYNIPREYKVEYLPEGFVYSTPLDSFSSTYEAVDSKISVTYKNEVKKVELPASSYKEIRDVYNKLANESKKRVILKKGE